MPAPRWPRSTPSREPSSNRPNICINAAPPWPPSAEIPREVVALFERAVDVDPNHPAALFGLAWKTTAAATTKWPSTCTSDRSPSFPPSVGNLLNLGLLYEDRQQYDRAQQCYQRILDAYPNHHPGTVVPQGRRGLGRHVLRRRRPKEARPDEPGAQRAGERLRTVGPQPQLPAEDGHQDLGRSGPLHRARPAGQQELRRNFAGRNSRDARLQGAQPGPIGHGKGRAGADVRARNSCRPTNRPCSTGRSPT